MGRVVGLLLLACALLAPRAAWASTRPKKVVLMYGDSLVFESAAQAGLHYNPTSWQLVSRAVPGQAPCDWLGELPDDLATYHPFAVEVASAGNTDGPDSCETAAQDSPQQLADYQTDLTSIVQQVTATPAQMVFVEDPPFLDSARNATVIQVDSDETQLSTQYHHVSVFTTARKAMSTRSGGYESYAKCLTTETAAEGCSNGLIPVRTLTGPSTGLHLCPDGNISLSGCDEYSSGEVRFGRYLATAAKAPKPVVP